LVFGPGKNKASNIVVLSINDKGNHPHFGVVVILRENMARFHMVAMALVWIDF
jgi:hypothetical protein